MISLSLKPQYVVQIDTLHVAEENIRNGEEADDDIDALAASLLNGQVAPLFVRKSRAGETGLWQVLDGRRRLLALKRLIKRKQISKSHHVSIIECTSAEEIAAAIVVSNAQRLAVTEADVLLAIHRMSKDFKTPEEIGHVLGLAPAEVRKKQKLGALDERLLKAFKSGKVKLDALKACARIDNPTPEQVDEWCRKAKKGELYAYGVNARRGIRATSNRLMLIDPDAYVAAGGRIAQDLFGEEPDEYLDPHVVEQLFAQALAPTAQFLRDQGVTVVFTDEDADLDEAVAEIPWNFAGATMPVTIHSHRNEVSRLNTALGAVRNDRAAALLAAEAWIKAKYHLAKLQAAPMEIIRCEICLGDVYEGISADFFVLAMDLAAYLEKQKAEDGAGEPVAKTREVVMRASAPAETPAPQLEDESGGWTTWQLREMSRTAGEALALSLVQNPDAAQDLLLASLFTQCCLNAGEVDLSHQLLRLKHLGGRLATHKAGKGLLDPVAEELLALKDRYAATGLHPIDWVRGLDLDTYMQLTALIVAMQVDTEEEGFHRRRPIAKAEAAVIGWIIGHDVRDHFRPGLDYYGACTKAVLADFVKEMGENPAPLMKLKRDQMAAKVFDLATKHDYVPGPFDFHIADEVPQPGADADQVDEVAA